MEKQKTLQRLLERLKAWAEACREAGCAARAFVFGSLVYRDGFQFEVARSDVDLLIELPEQPSTPLSRLASYERMLPINQALEADLCGLLERSDASSPITSIVPVTAFELRFGIHKGGKPDLFTASKFLPLLGDAARTTFPRDSPLGYGASAPAIEAIEQAQKYRHQFVAIATNRSRRIRPESDVADPIPKDLMRAAAQLRSYDDPRDPETRFDPDLGLDYMYDLVRARADEAPEYGDLRRWFGVRRGARGDRTPLTAGHEVLLREILATAAERSLQARERDVRAPAPSLPRLIEPGESTPTLPHILSGIERPVSSYIRAFIQEYTVAPFAGREDQSAALQAWLHDPVNRTGLLTAEAGRGKSALLVRWTDEVARDGSADVVFMPVSIRFGTAQVGPVARAVAGRLRYLAPGKHAIPADDPFVVLDECRDTLSADWAGPRPLLVVVDGLDEAIGWNPVDLIPDTVGKNIKILASARGSSVLWSDSLRWPAPRLFELPPLDRQAVRALVASVAELRAISDDESLIDRLLALTRGDPFIVLLHLDVKQVHEGSAEEWLRRIHQGSDAHAEPLKRIFDQWWAEQRKQWGESSATRSQHVQDVLNLLACAKGPLGLADLHALMGADPEDIRDALAQLTRFVIAQAGDRYVLGHPRLQDYFVGRLKAAGTYEHWKRKYLMYFRERRAELDARLPDEADAFSRRFGYVLRYAALHLVEDAPDDLLHLTSRPWLDGWRRLEGEDGVYGGFYEDVSRAERHARSQRLAGPQTRGLLIKASVTSLSSNVSPWLMRRLVETRLWPLSRALGVTDRMADDDERALALDTLAAVAEPPEQAGILRRALELARAPRARTLAWMIADLEGPEKQIAFDAILKDGTLLGGYSLVNVERLLTGLPEDFVRRLLAASRALSEPEPRARMLLAIAESASALPLDDRRGVLGECEQAIGEIASAENRAYYRHELVAAAAECAPGDRERLLRSAWDEIRSSGVSGEAAVNPLGEIATSLESMDAATRTEVINAMWRAIETTPMPWLALSWLGPHLGRMGFALQVLERSESTTLNEYHRGALLASLLPFAGDAFDRIWQRLQELKRREWALQPLSAQLRLLADGRRAVYLDEALDWVARHPDRSFLLGYIARNMTAGDPDAPRVLAAARALGDPLRRAERLADCGHLVGDDARSELMREILQAARDSSARSEKQRLLLQVAWMVGTDQTLLLAALNVSRQMKDEGLIASAVERVAVSLAEGNHIHAAVALASRAAIAFDRRPGWVLEIYVAVLDALPDGTERSSLWNTAMTAASRLATPFRCARFLAELTASAPASHREDHVVAAWEAVEQLELPFERTYVAIRLLASFKGDDRRAKLASVISWLSQDMTRHEHFLVTRDLLARLDDAERTSHRDALDASIDRVCRGQVAMDAVQEDVAAGEFDPLRDAGYLEELVPFLDLGRTCVALKACSPTAVSTLEQLALRVAELGRQTEALEAIRTLKDPVDRARGLARMLDHVPPVDRAAILSEARQLLDGATDPRQSAEAESFLVEHVTGSEREPLVRAALLRTPSMSHGARRRDTLHRLARSAAALLPFEVLDATWTELLARIAEQRREELVADLVALLPIVLRLGGSAAVQMIGETLLEIGEWFP
jgi:predicted nucleotidyltransferase